MRSAFPLNAGLLGLSLLFAAGCLNPTPLGAAPERGAGRGADRGAERGVALGLFASDPRYDYAGLLDEIAALGATDVQLDVVWLQSDVRAIDIARAGGVTAPDDVVVRTIQQARARGLRVTLFPIVRPRVIAPGEWRGVFAPSDGVDAWFAAYGRFIERMAELAVQGGAERLSVGSELCSLEEHQAHWRRLIADTRRHYQGALLYSANWDQLDRVRFWDALDAVGVTAYFELQRGDEDTALASLHERWRGPRAQLAALKARTQKPLIITELGFPSHADAARAPWDETRQAPPDFALQARLFRASCDALVRSGAFDGVTWWNWLGHGGLADTGYTPRHKPAARELAHCFAAP